jgi:hypothetical protein
LEFSNGSSLKRYCSDGVFSPNWNFPGSGDPEYRILGSKRHRISDSGSRIQIHYTVIQYILFFIFYLSVYGAARGAQEVQQDRDNEIRREWRLLAETVDRWLFWGFFFITTISTLVFIVILPYNKRGKFF